VAVPHFAVPFRVGGNGAFVVNEQDGLDDIVEAVACVIATPVGSRVEVPGFGVPRYEFGTPLPEEIVAAVAEWEPRADIGVDVAAALGDLGEITDVAVAVKPHL